MNTADASDQPVVLPPAWKDTLSHMLGAKSGTPGYRNFYCCIIGHSEDEPMLEAMCSAGLVFRGRLINNKSDRLYHATKKGCEFVGLSEQEIAQALSR